MLFLHRYAPRLLFVTALLVGITATALRNYLLFHSLAELYSVVVAMGVCMIAWNARRWLDGDYFLLIGVGFAFVGGMDILHTLASEGMGVFQPDDANLSTQLWLAARILQGLTFLLAALIIGRRLRARAIFVAYGLATALLLGLIFTNRFPVAYVQGVGLTPFEVVGEYSIAAILLVSMVLLLRQRRHFEATQIKLLVIVILLTIASEIALTQYQEAQDSANMVGHIFKVIAFYLLYLALVEIGLARSFDLSTQNLKQSGEALKESEKQIRQILESIGDAFYALDRQWRFRYVNHKALALWRKTSEELLGKVIWDVFPMGDHTESYAQMQHAMATHEHLEYESYSAFLDLWLYIRLYPAEDGLSVFFADISERKRTERALRESEERLHKLSRAVEQSPVCIVITDLKGNIEYINPKFTELTGYCFQEVAGKNPRFLKSGETGDEVYARLWQTITAGLEWRGELHNKKKNGELYWAAVAISPIVDAAGKPTHFVGITEDITARKAAEQQLHYLSTSDALTGLYNRAYFSGELKRLEHSRQYPVSLIVADMDNLKPVNDSKGHAAGDELLRRAAQLLRSAFRASDIIARIGGDEFAVLLPETDAAAAAEATARVQDALADYNAACADFPVQLSLGIATTAEGNLEATFHLADQRMYAAKRARKSA